MAHDIKNTLFLLKYIVSDSVAMLRNIEYDYLIIFFITTRILERIFRNILQCLNII